MPRHALADYYAGYSVLSDIKHHGIIIGSSLAFIYYLLNQYNIISTPIKIRAYTAFVNYLRYQALTFVQSRVPCPFVPLWNNTCCNRHRRQRNCSNLSRKRIRTGIHRSVTRYKPIRTYTLSVFYALLVSINISPESNRRKNITPPNWSNRVRLWVRRGESRLFVNNPQVIQSRPSKTYRKAYFPCCAGKLIQHFVPASKLNSQ